MGDMGEGVKNLKKEVTYYVNGPIPDMHSNIILVSNVLQYSVKQLMETLNV